MENNSSIKAPTVIPSITAFSIMFVSIGMSCFIWQSLTAGWMFYKSRKPIIGLVFFQSFLGVIVTFATLLASITTVNCVFLLLFSVAGVNIGDISLQFVLLWKAYLGHNRSKLILLTGCLPIFGIMAFIIVNFTFGRSKTVTGAGVCNFEYPSYIVVAKSIIDCTSNTFLSVCFISVIHRHYRVFGSSVQKTLIKEGLIYCFGVCISNILTGILLVKKVFGGSTPIIYTIDWYLASYLIIKQLSYKKNEENEHVDNASACGSEEETYTISNQKETSLDQAINKYYKSIDGTIVVNSPVSLSLPKFEK